MSLFGHKFDIGVHNPSPLYGPCPQHATFDVINPAQKINYVVIKFTEVILYVQFNNI